MTALYVIVELEDHAIPACYYGGHFDEEVPHWGTSISRPMWTGDEDMAHIFTDRAEAEQLAEDFESHARMKGWPISYRAEERGYRAALAR